MKNEKDRFGDKAKFDERASAKPSYVVRVRQRLSA